MEKGTEEWGWYNLKYDLAESIIPKLETINDAAKSK